MTGGAEQYVQRIGSISLAIFYMAIIGAGMSSHSHKQNEGKDNIFHVSNYLKSCLNYYKFTVGWSAISTTPTNEIKEPYHRIIYLY
jgi:hypothetical protein